MTRHRVERRADHAGPARTPDERHLEQLQKQLTRLEQDVVATETERDQLAMQLWMNGEMAQSEITERLDRADRAAGGNGISYAQVQKRLYRAREAVAS